MKRLVALVLSSILLLSCVITGYADYLTTEDIFGTFFPSCKFATDKNPATESIDNNIRKEEYVEITQEDFDRFGSYLTASNCVLQDFSNEGKKFFATVSHDSKSINIVYDSENSTLIVTYPEGTRPEKEALKGWTKESTEASIFPYVESVFGYYMPSIAAALKKAPTESKSSDDGVSQSYKDFTDEDYNIFSVYLSEKGCIVDDITMDGKKMTVKLSYMGTPFTFIYDRDKTSASAVYAKGTKLDSENDCSIMGHIWTEATCTHPKTCNRCGLTEGDLKEHQYGTWKTTKKATTKEEGEKQAICKVCGATKTEAISKLPLSFNMTEFQVISKFNSLTKADNEAYSIKEDTDGRYYIFVDNSPVTIDIVFDTDESGKVTSVELRHEALSPAPTADLTSMELMLKFGKYISRAVDPLYDDGSVDYANAYFGFLIGNESEIRYRTENALHLCRYSYFSPGGYFSDEGHYLYYVTAE